MSERYNRLVEKIKNYAPQSDFSLLEKAYKISRKVHEGQTRVTGEPFILHPLEVAIILADLEMDCTSIIAGILHDTVEDTDYTQEQLEKDFGEEVSLLVDGVTKLKKIPYTSKEELQVENLRKMFLAMAKDIRVILIKLADRLHNIRTLKYMSREKQIQKARETLEIYAPLAHRLGISKIKWELEDICLRYIDPKGYYELVDKIDKKRQAREEYINTISEMIQNKTEELKIEAHIEGRPKHFYSIYRKMVEQNKSIDQIYDLFAVRILVKNVKDCYSVLGMVHEIFKPIPGRFKDYIAMPKPNMYQSLHTTLVGPQGYPFEIQIRTWEMHRIAEVGIAAHWNYKEGRSGGNDVDSKLAWLRQLLDWQKEMKDAREFMETLKIDLFTDEVFVFTPKGDVINMPVGSCPVDFAYYIHSEVGNKMTGAKVNGKIVQLEYKLKTGDIVEILSVGGGNGPSRDWLKFVRSSQAKNKINQWFKKEKREENIIRGKEAIDKELKKQTLSYNELFKPEWVEIVVKKYGFNTLDDIFAAIGYGAITSNKVISRLKDEYKKTLKPEELEKFIENSMPTRQMQTQRRKTPDNGVVVKGVDNCLVRISRCCNPVPGDTIIGYITRGRGVSVHREDCSNVANSVVNGDNRLIDVSWYLEKKSSYKADVLISANDRAGLMVEITNVIAKEKISLKAVNAKTNKDHTANMNLTLEIVDTNQLNNIIKKLRKIEGVFEVKRNRN